MTNLFDYLIWRGDITFNQVPFNKLDALCLAQISYVIFDGLISEDFKHYKTLNQLGKEFKKLPDFKSRLKIGFLINDKTSDLMISCGNTKRFKDVKVCGYKNIFSENDVEQFAAITFIINKKAIVAYRGTDDSLIGFQEDFQIGYKDEIPAQKYGLEYFADLGKAYPFYHYILLGHSKGGNLAMYTAVNCHKNLRRKITGIYNFDGPGFTKDFFQRYEYLEIKDKLYSFYPQLSIVGMLFHHPENYEIVESSNFAIMQHDALSWNVIGPNFVTRDEFMEEGKIFAKSFNNWIDKISMKERQQFVESLFFLIKASGYKNLLDIVKNLIPASAKIIAAYTKMNQKDKEEFKEIFGLLLSTVKSQLPIFKFLSK